MSEQSTILTLQLQKMRREILGNINDTSLDDIFKDKLEDAKLVFLDKVYPFDKDISEIPKRYIGWQTRCAIELYNIQEDGDFTSYSENGLSWSKENSGLSLKLIEELPPPQAGVPS